MSAKWPLVSEVEVHITMGSGDVVIYTLAPDARIELDVEDDYQYAGDGLPLLRLAPVKRTLRVEGVIVPTPKKDEPMSEKDELLRRLQE